VTIHADLGGRNAGERGLFHRRVAVTAIDAVVTNVVFMAELHRLAARDTDLRHIGGTVNRGESAYEDDDETDAPEYAHPGDGVRAPMKYLSHRPIPTLACHFRQARIVIVFLTKRLMLNGR
jgi:hypothetical protein